MTEKLNKILNKPLSYKKLCEALNIPTKSGKSKIYQLKDLALYCNIQISSNPTRYTIAEIYDQALIPSKAKFQTPIEVIVMRLFKANNYETLYLTNSRLLECMKLVNSHGGYSIGVFNAETNDKNKVYKMMRDKRIKYYAPADYRENTEIDKLVKSIIDRTITNEVLETKYYKCRKECIEADKLTDVEKQKKIDLIMALEESKNFAMTHSVIKELNMVRKWDNEEKEILFRIGLENRQVFYILKDKDVRVFYRKLLYKSDDLSENATKIKDEIERKN